MQICSSFNPRSAVDNLENLNTDLNAVHTWTKDNCLRLNPTKSEVILIGSSHALKYCENLDPNIILADTKLVISDHPKNLGLLFDKHLSFGKHVDYLCRTSYYKLKLLYPIRSQFSEAVRLRLIDSLILSSFTYGDCVYGPCLTQENKRRLQVAQNYCIRFVTNVQRFDHITPYIRSLNTLKLHERRFIHYVVLVWKVVCTETPSYLFNKIQFRSSAHDLNLRKILTATTPCHHTAKFETSFSYLAAYILNTVGPSLVGRSLPNCSGYLKNAIKGNSLASVDLTKF